jgi:hypothetical protein
MWDIIVRQNHRGDYAAADAAFPQDEEGKQEAIERAYLRIQSGYTGQKKIEIEPRDGECVLLVNGGQEGLYETPQRAKAAARRFVHHYERLKWNGNKAEIVQKGGK